MKLALVMLLAGFSTVILAAEKNSSSQAPKGPVDIRSDNLTVQQKRHQAVFSGNVLAVQGDLKIKCERLTVFYAGPQNKQSTSGEIQKMVFEGNVAITQSKRKGFCRRAEYHRRKELIVCAGDPWVVEGENKIRGDLIEYDLGKDEVKVTRPRALIRLDEATKKKGG